MDISSSTVHLVQIYVNIDSEFGRLAKEIYKLKGTNIKLVRVIQAIHGKPNWKRHFYYPKSSDLQKNAENILNELTKTFSLDVLKLQDEVVVYRICNVMDDQKIINEQFDLPQSASASKEYIQLASNNHKGILVTFRMGKGVPLIPTLPLLKIGDCSQNEIEIFIPALNASEYTTTWSEDIENGCICTVTVKFV